jgi:hypothetical protein
VLRKFRIVDIRHHFYASIITSMCAVNLAAQAAPANDDYEARTQLIGDSIVFAGTTVGATVQTNEIKPISWQDDVIWPTVWWSWTAAASGPVSVDLVNYSDDRVRSWAGYVAVWEHVDWTNRTGENHYGVRTDVCGRHYFLFTAVAGTTYDIQASVAPYGMFTLRLVQTNGPTILAPPHDRLMSPGGSAFLGVVAGGSGPLTYQWRLNGANIPQQTWPILSLDKITETMAGTYTVVVSNATSSVESPPAYVSLRTNNVHPVLTAVGINPDSTFSFAMNGEPLTSYRVESSTNLVDWRSEESFHLPLPYNIRRNSQGRETAYSSVIRNDTIANVFSLAVNQQNTFFRVTRYAPNFDPTTDPAGTPAMSETCVNNLRKIRFAKELWENRDLGDYWGLHDSNFDAPSWTDLTNFMDKVACPYLTDDPSSDPYSMDASYSIDSVDRYPFCKMDAFDHELEEPPDSY